MRPPGAPLHHAEASIVLHVATRANYCLRDHRLDIIGLLLLASGTLPLTGGMSSRNNHAPPSSRGSVASHLDLRIGIVHGELPRAVTEERDL